MQSGSPSSLSTVVGIGCLQRRLEPRKTEDRRVITHHPGVVHFRSEGMSGPQWRFLASLCGDTALADDIAQEALVRAYVMSDRFAAVSKPGFSESPTTALSSI